MRLLRLRLRNIASLKGDHEISFEDIQRESQLFAITGETGSGKSTILNSVSLALYGQTYKRTSINHLDIVTLGEKEGSIELIFQVKGKNYLADWRARVRKQNGEPYAVPQTPAKSLYTLQGTEFDSPKVIAAMRPEELLNLSFEQFCKCIILNQGEFARFLTSNFSERKDILEKLYPGELLDNISRELEGEKKALEKSRHDLEIELHTLRGDEIPGDALKAQKAQLETELKDRELLFTRLEKIDFHFTSLLAYFEKQKKNEQAKATVREAISQETTRYNVLLKKSEELQDALGLARKEQDEKLPRYQELLQKESKLEHLRRLRSDLQQELGEKTKTIEALRSQKENREAEVRELSLRLSGERTSFTLPLGELRAARNGLQEFFDHWHLRENLETVLKGKAPELARTEDAGKELREKTEFLERKLSGGPDALKILETKLIQERTVLRNTADEKLRAQILAQELKKQLHQIHEDSRKLGEQKEMLALRLRKLAEEILPLEATVKLEELLVASSICVEHAISTGAQSCPVCDSQVSGSGWEELRRKLQRTDLKKIREELARKQESIFRMTKEHEHALEREKILLEEIRDREEKLSSLSVILEASVEAPEAIEARLEEVRKSLYEFSVDEKELQEKRLELARTRERYLKLKAEFGRAETDLANAVQKTVALAGMFSNLMPHISGEKIHELKIETRKLEQFLESEAAVERARKDLDHLSERYQEIQLSMGKLNSSLTSLNADLSSLEAQLLAALGDKKASELIDALSQRVKQRTDELTRHNEELALQDGAVKNGQGRLGQLEELSREYDIHFARELQEIKVLSLSTPGSPATKPLFETLSKLALDFSSPRELLVPLDDLIKKEKLATKDLTNHTRMEFAGISEKLASWEKLQDKILLAELRLKDIRTALDRKLRLYEVLGKDELRTFVLSLVEESLIYQTNEELQKLCQGRYEIVHQTKSMKMTPEFYILDKFREGGRRKVSTLSGGETFMVSLAMALGLAEMTRGQAEIDSLFIDEGFGTLDPESLEDVLGMLQQIQTRGLMVGVISHIKTLTNAIPVNLQLTKKQDGTSSVMVLRN